MRFDDDLLDVGEPFDVLVDDGVDRVLLVDSRLQAARRFRSAHLDGVTGCIAVRKQTLVLKRPLGCVATVTNLLLGRLQFRAAFLVIVEIIPEWICIKFVDGVQCLRNFVFHRDKSKHSRV